MAPGPAARVPLRAPSLLAALLHTVLLLEGRHRQHVEHAHSATSGTSEAVRPAPTSAHQHGQHAAQRAGHAAAAPLAVPACVLSSAASAPASPAPAPTATASVGPRDPTSQGGRGHHGVAARRQPGAVLTDTGAGRDVQACSALRCMELRGAESRVCGVWEDDLFIFSSICDMLWFNCLAERVYQRVDVELCEMSSGSGATPEAEAPPSPPPPLVLLYPSPPPIFPPPPLPPPPPFMPHQPHPLPFRPRPPNSPFIIISRQQAQQQEGGHQQVPTAALQK